MRTVARQSDVRTSVAAQMTGKFGVPPATATGTWTALAPTVETLDAVRAAGQPLLASVSCHFTFLGKSDSDGTTVVNGQADLTLRPSPTALRVGGSFVLCQDDKVSDGFSNAISIVPGGPLRTA